MTDLQFLTAVLASILFGVGTAACTILAHMAIALDRLADIMKLNKDHEEDKS